MVVKEEIKDYWETHLPQTWYSKSEDKNLKYYQEIESQRYSKYKKHLRHVAEFNSHPNEKVLEIGCGLGTDLLQYAKNNSIVTGMDLTETSIDESKRNFELHKIDGTFLKADAENLPFEDNMFDLVFCYGVLHHTPDTEKAIKEIHRILKPNGKAIIMLYAKGFIYYTKIFFYGGILQGGFLRMSKQEVYNKYSEKNLNSPLTKFFQKKQINNFFKDFKTTDMRRYHLGPLMESVLPYGLVKILEKFMGGDYIIKVTK